MRQKIKLALAVLLLTVSLLNIKCCADRAETVSCFPSSAVNVQLSLNLPAYYKLQSVGGWMYINEQSSGTRGLIVVHTGSGFAVYDRNAPHICPETNTTLEVVDDIKIVCPKDGAEWILLTGQPTKIAGVAPKTYPYTYDSARNILQIYY